MSSVYIGNSEPNIILLGDIMLDHNIKGYCNKIANEGPIPVVNVNNETYSIGGCGNVLLNLFSLGAKYVHLFSRIGNDVNGINLISLLPSNTINNMITDNNFPTICKTRIYSDRKMVARYDREEITPITSVQEELIISNIKNTICNNKISSLIFSDYNKGFLTKHLCQSIINLCNEYNIPTIIDPKYDYTKYIGCTVIKPNRVEVNNIFKINLDITSIEEAHKTIHNILKCKLSVITLSGDGISAFMNDVHYRAVEDVKDVIDVTGAGDIVCAVLGIYYGLLDNIQQLIMIANHLASISVSHIGVYNLTNSDLINTYKFIHRSKLVSFDIISKLDIDNVVFTNGCFDIIHSAHIELFRYCKTLGKIVIVGLNSDESIKRLKGPSRPINNIQERVKILDAIDYIDFIIIFNEDTPLELIKEIKPDFLVKGGDYIVDDIIGKEFAKETIIFNYIHGLSTSNIIKRIKN